MKIEPIPYLQPGRTWLEQFNAINEWVARTNQVMETWNEKWGTDE